jgi:mono/diheme cytochrome c family protein
VTPLKRHFLRVARTGLTAAFLLVALPLVAAEPAGSDFVRNVQPIFVEHCYQCHGPDKQEAGLRLDQREAAVKGGDSGAWFVAGKSAESDIVRRITAGAEERMPPADSQSKPLSEAQIAAIKSWIDAGADWPQPTAGGSNHWAFQPIVRPAPPAVQNEAWVRSPIDRFVLAQLEARGIAPSPEADRTTLIKRLSYDLLGLPPNVADVDAFVSDASPDAYERLVDRLLDSPRFGERFARHWLDKARYADSDGYEKDNPRPDAWRYRDWVIDAVNRDLPLDEFTIEQLAGDLLPGATPDQRLATAFHRQTLTNTEGGTDQEQFRVEAVFDRVATTGTVWLGLTVGCAQCHTHKYDPITHQEYYQLFAFFNNGDESQTDVPLVGDPLAKFQREKQEAVQKLAEARPKLEKLRANRAASVAAWEAELKAAPVASEEFHPVELVSAASEAEAEIKLLSDGSYLVAGKNPDVDRLTIVAKSDRPQISGFRLETLTHDSLGGRGPGRTGHGNFVLGEIKVLAAAENKFDKKGRVKLSAAEADYSQDGFSPDGVLDKDEKTGWAVGGKTGENHWAAFYAETPIDTAKRPWLQLVLSQNYGGQHTLGRFRITAISGSNPLRGIPENIRTVLAVPATQRTPEQVTALTDYYVNRDPEVGKLAAEVKTLEARATAEPTMNVRVIAQRTAEPRKSHILARGDFLDPQAEVQPGTLDVLPKLPAAAPKTADRLDLARWLVDPANPLTRRVLVNQLWSHVLGRGIVRTLNDFGVRGERPTHPELLDWLACELESQHWSRKDLLRVILASATYRQSSATRPELVEVDPLNDTFHRQNRHRVEAETVRDLTLAVAGLLSDKIGGPSVFPPMPEDIAALSYANNFKWSTSVGEDRYRRGMYTFFKRTAPFPDLTTFDCPDANTTCIERRASNTPLQALTTLNNDAFAEASRALARRALAAPAADDATRLATALRWCVARQPSPQEVAAFGELLAESRGWYAERGEDAVAAVGDYKIESIAPAENAAWIATVRMMLNLDEFLTRE